MIAVVSPSKHRTVPPCKNETMREAAHKKLDQIMDEVDSVRGAFGEVGVKVAFADGQFSFNIKTFKEENHKV